MNKFWLVVKHEYMRHVRRKRFIFLLLSLPLIVALSIGIGVLATLSRGNSAPVGLVDTGNIFPRLMQPPQTKSSLIKPAEVIKYVDEESARSALESGAIQAYFVLDENYLQNGQAKMYSLKQPGDNVHRDVSNVLRYNLILDQPKTSQQRLIEGNELIIRSVDGKRELSEDNILGFLLPMISGIFFMLAISTTGGYLLQAMVEEKENRTMEIMVTSLSPQKLMSAKIFGNLAIGLTQLVVWIVFGWISILVAKQFQLISTDIQLDISHLLLLVVTFLLALVMIGSLMAMAGAMVTEAREAQQVAGLFTLPIMLPYFFISTIMLNPNGSISVGLSLFPLTSPITLPIRVSLTMVPIWQILAALLLLGLCAAASVGLASRAFQMGMLRYGKRLSLKELFTSLKTSRQARQ